MFDWIKRSVKNAVIAGVNEAVAELTGATNRLPPQPAEVLLLLPAPTTDEDEAPTKSKSSRKLA